MRCSSRIASPILRFIRATTTHLVLRVLYHSCSHSCNTKFSTKTDQNARIRHNSTRFLPYFFFFCLILEENRLQAGCQLNKISILSNWRCCAGEGASLLLRLLLLIGCSRPCLRLRCCTASLRWELAALARSGLRPRYRTDQRRAEVDAPSHWGWKSGFPTA